MAKQKKTRTLRSYLVAYSLFLSIAALVLGAYVLAMGVWYQRTGQIGILIPLIVVGVLATAAIVLVVVILARKLIRYYHDSLYLRTKENYDLLTLSQTEISSYPEVGVSEFDSLNKAVSGLRETLKSVRLICHNRDYSTYGLKEAANVPGAYELKEFEENIGDVIAASLCFRNCIVEIYYDLPTGTALGEVEQRRLLQLAKSRLDVYESPLYLFPEDRGSLYVYLPRVDSLKVLEEKLNALVMEVAISSLGAEGHVALGGKYSVVCYPFSDTHELFPDLRYAKRQGKVGNFYLPKRLYNVKIPHVGRSTMYLNQMSKILYRLASAEADEYNKQKIRAVIAEILAEADGELGFSSSGIVAYDAEANAYICKDSVGDNHYFPYLEQVDAEFVEAVSASMEEDHSFYGRDRTMMSKALGRYADIMGFASCFFYALVKEGKPNGFVFFISQDGGVDLDSYQRESLSALCYHISSSYAMGAIIEDAVEADRRFEAILTTFDSGIYQVEREGNILHSLSPTLAKAFPNAKIGEPCYKTLYGLEKPCKSCPLLTGSKKVDSSGKHTLVSSLTLDVKRGSLRTIFVQREHESGILADNRFDRELLINSFMTMTEQINNHYLLGDSGYLLLLRIDNHASLLERFGSEGLLLVYRNLIQNLKGLFGGGENIYYYDPQTLALLFPSIGQTDVINRCEDVYKITKNITFDADNVYSFEMTYLPMHFPQGYAGSEDFLRHVTHETVTRKVKRGQDTIYFDDSDYVRPASRKDFMLSVIDEQFGKETFNVLLQPMVHASTDKIFGAEVLLRIQDEQRHIVFFADELVEVASKNGKIPIITKALLRYANNFYQSVGKASLKQMGFSRLGLNTEVSLFSDPTFEGFFEEFIKETSFPSDFLSFEIAEREASRHLEEFQKASKMLQRFQIHLVIDQYTGANISVDDLVRLGFNQIKVSRNLIHNIEVDQGRLESLTQLLTEAKQKGLEISLVGVENIDQFELLMKINPNMDMQGFYFFRPLEKNALVDAVRKYNSK